MARAAGAIKDYTRYHELYAELASVPTAIHDDDTDAATMAARIRGELASLLFRIT